MKNRKMALARSMLALLLCLSMLVGTTFAWFTDSVKSGINTVAAGVLDVELYHSNAAVTNEKVGSNTKLFMDLQGKPIVWEPGVVSYENLRIANEGDLALAYQLAINTANENYVLDPSGAQYGLSQILKVGFVKGGISATDRAGVVASVEDANWTTMSGFLRSGALLPEGAGTSEEIWGIVIYWEPGDNDNLWNLNNGKQLDRGEYLMVDLGVKLIATQMEGESDSFNDEYDFNAKAEFFSGFQGGVAGAAVTAGEDGLTTAEAAMDGGDVSAWIPVGVHVADGATSLQLAVTLKESSEANIQLNDSEEMRPLDVHIEGVAQGNTVPMLITLKHYLSTGINTGALRLYHVENGATVAMTQVSNPVNHNEFSYDPLTGDVTLALASFSEVAVVADSNNTWDGTTETAYTGSGTEADPYLIASADQLAYFRTQVDNGNSFAGKVVKLNNNITLSNVNFDPIGWGYANASHNRGGAEGNVFMGTFDGNNKIIFDLYQSGWDLESKTGTDYTYTNCGFGLFAAASGATFQDLTISGANVTVECVEAGVLVGLSQNSCTYENINIYDSKIANYQRPAGGLIGEVSGDGTTTISNVTIGSDVVVGSLWGDFDAPCGGVIGARWDDANADPQIIMRNVEVGCRMDVYSDVTSAYQWYAYRRAGMLIGNTELSEPNNKHLAAAPFLKCDNVKVYYGNWAAYHYCQFTNQDNAWCNNYPWVRAEVGENCSAYSNPRYGQPVIGGVAVSSDDHTNCTNGNHRTELRFNQLYGGGQGVYGQPKHDGVEVTDYRYSITYVNDSEVLAIKYVVEDGVVDTEHKAAEDLVKKWAAENITGTWAFGGWMNAGSTKLSEIAADNTKDIVLYPYFNKPYTARFVDQKGKVLAWCLFHAEDLTKLDKTKDTAQSQLPSPGKDFEFDYWEVNVNGKKVQYAKNSFASYTTDVTIYPVYRYTGNLKLTPVDEDNDGTIDYYKVEAVDVLDEVTTIPGNVNGVPVKLVEKLYKNDNNWDFGSGVKTIIMEEGVEELAHNSLGYTEDLTTVKLPSTLKVLGKNTFSRNTGDDKKVITIEYAGTMAEWQEILNNPNSSDEWHNGLKTGTKVICTDGYYELKMTEILWGAYQKYEWTAYPNS